MSVGLTGTALSALIEQYQADFAGASLQGPLGPSLEPLAAQPQTSNLTTTEADVGLYDIYRVEAKYVQDTGKLPLPIATGGSTRVAKVSQPFGFKLVLFEVARSNAFPQLPAIEETDGCQLLESELTALNDVTDASSNKRVYRSAGYYLYLLKSPLVPGTDDIPVPSLPNISSKSLPLTSEDFKEGIAPVEASEDTTWSI